MRAPVNTRGDAQGSSTRQKIARGVAFSVRIVRRSSAGAEANPSSALAVIGKKQTSATISAFGARPKPR